MAIREIDLDIAFEEAKFQLKEAQLDIEDEEHEARFAQAREEAMEQEKEDWEMGRAGKGEGEVGE